MFYLALVGPSQDPAGLSSIHLEEQIATSTAEIEQTDVAQLGPSQPAGLSSIYLKEQIATSTTAIEQKDEVALPECND
jgi:hypothetical protein